MEHDATAAGSSLAYKQQSTLIECLTEATTMTTVLSDTENELHPENEVEVPHQVCYFMIVGPLYADKSSPVICL